MNDKMQKQISNAAIDMYESLRESVEEAGGSFSKEYFMNLKVDELISHLCTNKIRFVYNPNYKFECFKYTVNELQKSNEALELRLKGEISSREYRYKDLVERSLTQSKEKDEKIKKLRSDIFHLESALDHSFSAEEVTEKIDKVVDETLKRIIRITMESGCILTNDEYKKHLKGNWKYNL